MNNITDVSRELDVPELSGRLVRVYGGYPKMWGNWVRKTSWIVATIAAAAAAVGFFGPDAVFAVLVLTLLHVAVCNFTPDSPYVYVVDRNIGNRFTTLWARTQNVLANNSLNEVQRDRIERQLVCVQDVMRKVSQSHRKALPMRTWLKVYSTGSMKLLTSAEKEQILKSFVVVKYNDQGDHYYKMDDLVVLMKFLKILEDQLSVD